jgi:hypothetical protein
MAGAGGVSAENGGIINENKWRLAAGESAAA